MNCFFHHQLCQFLQNSFSVNNVVLNNNIIPHNNGLSSRDSSNFILHCLQHLHVNLLPLNATSSEYNLDWTTVYDDAEISNVEDSPRNAQTHFIPRYMLWLSNLMNTWEVHGPIFNLPWLELLVQHLAMLCLRRLVFSFLQITISIDYVEGERWSATGRQRIRWVMSNIRYHHQT